MSFTDGLGAVGARRLIERFGSAQAAVATDRAALAAVIGAPIASRLLAPDATRDRAIDEALAWGAQPGHHVLGLGAADYPEALLALHDPPPALFVDGDPGWLAAPAVAVVGSREATGAGLEHARDFARALASAGRVVVSGLAAGIDAAAHAGALLAARDGGAGTVAVLGTGVDRVYPAAHAELAARIRAHGALISEWPLGTPAARHRFPRRNRLIAALAGAVLVVEAAPHSGSLITARLALELGRDVCAIPGSIRSTLSRGCHALIREGAALVESPADVLGELDGPLSAIGSMRDAGRRASTPDPRRAPTAATGAPSTGERAPGPPAADGPTGGPADAQHRPLLRALGWDPVDADTLAERLASSPSDLLPALFLLELGGTVERLPDGRYVRRQ